MEIEKLTKSQIVLLTLLVSFVTSMATGIVTVSLMEQAPPAIAQTVNRVVERTVERVVPQESQVATPAVVTTEKTVVVRESDLIAQAVKDASPAIVRLYERQGGTEAFIGFGVAISDSRLLTDSVAVTEGSTLVTRDGDTIIEFRVTERNSSLGVAVLEKATSSSAHPWTPISMSTKAPTLGQTVVTLTGEKIPRIGQGIVTTVGEGTVLETTIEPTETLSGGPLITVDGELIGLRTGVSRTSANGGFITIQSIRNMLSTGSVPSSSTP